MFRWTEGEWLTWEPGVDHSLRAHCPQAIMDRTIMQLWGELERTSYRPRLGHVLCVKRRRSSIPPPPKHLLKITNKTAGLCLSNNKLVKTNLTYIILAVQKCHKGSYPCVIIHMLLLCKDYKMDINISWFIMVMPIYRVCAPPPPCTATVRGFQSCWQSAENKDTNCCTKWKLGQSRLFRINPGAAALVSGDKLYARYMWFSMLGTWCPEKDSLLLCHLQLKHMEVEQRAKDWTLIHFVLSDDTMCVHCTLQLKRILYYKYNIRTCKKKKTAHCKHDKINVPTSTGDSPAELLLWRQWWSHCTVMTAVTHRWTRVINK